MSEPSTKQFSLRFRADRAYSPVLDRYEPVNVASCECGSLAFGIFQLQSQNHFHVQCLSCGSSFCPAGECLRAEEANAASS